MSVAEKYALYVVRGNFPATDFWNIPLEMFHKITHAKEVFDSWMHNPMTEDEYKMIQLKEKARAKVLQKAT